MSLLWAAFYASCPPVSSRTLQCFQETRYRSSRAISFCIPASLHGGRRPDPSAMTQFSAVQGQLTRECVAADRTVAFICDGLRPSKLGRFIRLVRPHRSSLMPPSSKEQIPGVAKPSLPLRRLRAAMSSTACFCRTLLELARVKELVKFLHVVNIPSEQVSLREGL